MNDSSSSLYRRRLLLVGLFLTLESSCVLADLIEGDYIYVVTNGTVTITGFNTAYNGALTITNTLGGYPVTAIGDAAFFNCLGLTSVTIPDSVTNVGNSAFVTAIENEYTILDFEFHFISFADFEGVAGGNNLTNVIFGNGVINIGQFAFRNCFGLTSITLPDKLTSIGDFAFTWCTNLASVTMGKSINKIGRDAFSCCRSLASVDIPDQVATISPFAFSECTSLAHLFIPEGVKNIGDYAFQGCTALTSITIPNSVTNIGRCAFGGCFDLTCARILNFNESISLGYGAFGDCTKLSNVFFSGNAPINVDSTIFAHTPSVVYYLQDVTGWDESFAGRPTLCWNPTVRRDAGFGFTSDRFGFNIAGTTNIPVVIEACTNLSAGVWTPLTNATLGSAGEFRFTDPASTNLPSRFYRIVWP